MNVKFEKKFQKDILNVSNTTTLNNIERIIFAVKEAKKISDIPNIKKLKGTKAAYRIRVGDYRMGVYIENDTVEFICILPRNIVYRHFPEK